MGNGLSLACVLLGLWLCACGGAVDVEEGDRVDTRRSDHEESIAVAVAQPSTRSSLVIVRAGAGDAEDGAGHVVQSTERIALEVDAHAFPPRALDPVLTIGALRFVHYSHPHPGVLRFTADGISRLPLGAEVSIQYGDEVSSRRVLRRALSSADVGGLAP